MSKCIPVIRASDCNLHRASGMRLHAIILSLFSVSVERAILQLTYLRTAAVFLVCPSGT